MQLCSDINYGGKCVTVDAGRYNYNAVANAIGNDSISSIRILTPGYSVLTYENEFGGGKKDFTSDVPDLRSIGWNDTISSLVVTAGVPIPLAPASIPATVVPENNPGTGVGTPIVTPGTPTVVPAATPVVPVANPVIVTPAVTPAKDTVVVPASAAPLADTSAAPAEVADTPAGTADEMSNKTWVIIALAILFIVIVLAAASVYFVRSKVKEASSATAPSATATPVPN